VADTESAPPARAPVERSAPLDRSASYATSVPASTTPLARTSTYVTYSSWAPSTDYRSSYYPSYSSSYGRKYQNEYTSGYNYSRPASHYTNVFDSYVRTGAFSQSSYATDRARSRSRSRAAAYRRDRSSSGYGTYAPPPLRRSRDYSSPIRGYGLASAAPSRTGSFINFMDYIATTDRNLKRSTSRSANITEDYSLARTSSRASFNPADAISHWYDKQIDHIDSYSRGGYDSSPYGSYGYSSRYGGSRPSYSSYSSYGGIGRYGRVPRA